MAQLGQCVAQSSTWYFTEAFLLHSMRISNFICSFYLFVAYQAPEMLTRRGYNAGVDWWALGVICFEMLTGKLPFQSKNEKELHKKIMYEKLSSPSYLTAEAHSLLKGLLEKDL